MSMTIKQLRLAKEISQEQMANVCNVHRNTYAVWEENQEDISVKNAKLIAKALGEDVSIFFKD